MTGPVWTIEEGWWFLIEIVVDKEMAACADRAKWRIGPGHAVVRAYWAFEVDDRDRLALPARRLGLASDRPEGLLPDSRPAEHIQSTWQKGPVRRIDLRSTATPGPRRLLSGKKGKRPWSQRWNNLRNWFAVAWSAMAASRSAPRGRSARRDRAISRSSRTIDSPSSCAARPRRPRSSARTSAIEPQRDGAGAWRSSRSTTRWRRSWPSAPILIGEQKAAMDGHSSPGLRRTDGPDRAGRGDLPVRLRRRRRHRSATARRSIPARSSARAARSAATASSIPMPCSIRT